MECRCGAPMKDIGTAASGVYLRWCPDCGRLHRRSMNPSIPGENWIEPKATFSALLEFIATIDATGGLVEDPEGSGHHVPAADDSWVDLASTYENACSAVGKEPQVRS